MIQHIFDLIWGIIMLVLLLICSLLTIFGGVIVIAAPDISSWDRLITLLMTMFFGTMAAGIITLLKE